MAQRTTLSGLEDGALGPGDALMVNGPLLSGKQAHMAGTSNNVMLNDVDDDADDKSKARKSAGLVLKCLNSPSRFRRVPLAPASLALSIFGLIACRNAAPQSAARYLRFVNFCCGYGALFSLWLWRWIAQKEAGDAAMRAVSGPVAEGAAAFLRVQYGTIFRLALGLALLIGLSHQMRAESSSDSVFDAGTKNEGSVGRLSKTTTGCIAAFAFCVGAACSATSGYLSMLVASAANVRVAWAARRSYAESLVLCFRGGVFSAVLNLTLCVLGLSTLYVTFDALNVVQEENAAQDIPLLLVGYGFGASFVALFAQLGGGIYTKAADVGADLVGKTEASIPEDDPRNPAVVADLVGDLVGDCAGSAADVFESVGAEMIGAMILGGSLAKKAKLLNAAPLVFFPLVVHALDVVASSIGAAAGVTKGAVARRASVLSSNNEAIPDPMPVLLGGYKIALVAAGIGFAAACRCMLDVPIVDADAMIAPPWIHFFACGLLGFFAAFACAQSSRYYTDYAYPPVRKIAAASTTGHGTTIIVGLAVGLESTAVPTIVVAFGVVASYHLGRTAGLANGVSDSIEAADVERASGLFGTAVATMGMLATAVYVLSINAFGPIADNAGGIVEMSGQSDRVRDATDALDAAGNVTKAITKGYSIGSASLACFLLFAAFMDEFSDFAGVPFRHVDVAAPEVLVGGLLGVAMIFLFSGMAIAAVGRTASEVVREVRRQFRENPAILDNRARPDYGRCVAIVANAALDEMTVPGLLCVAAPVAVGLIFRAVGEATDRPLLGAEALAGYLIFGTVAGILMALFMDNVGGAWDNAKKYIEAGHYGGKGSDAHKAAVTGDTVGDPLKDTSGPSLHVVIKLLSTTTLVLGPLFVRRQTEALGVHSGGAGVLHN